MKYFLHPHLLDPSHAFPFLEDPRWQRVDQAQDADYIPVLVHTDQEPRESQRSAWQQHVPHHCEARVLMISLFHADDGKDTSQFVHRCFVEFYGWIHLKKIYVHTNLALEQPDTVFYDILLRRTQALFQEARWDLLGTHWLDDAPPSLFLLKGIPRQKTLKQKILSPIRIYPENSSPRMRYRTLLRQFLDSQPKDFAYYTRDQSHTIPSQAENDRLRYHLENLDGSVWQPIHNSVYEQTLASAYVETLSLGPNRTITEKTWDPLVKGHFVLPFAYPGIIQDLEHMGIRFPKFINYDYSCILDPEERWRGFIKELERLGRLETRFLELCYEQNHEILRHNRKTVLEKPVDRLIDCLAF